MTPEQRRAWRRKVFGHPELTPAQRLVLLALETFADYPKGTNARPGAARLADMCALKMRAVEAALSEGRRLYLIEQTGRANPKRGYAAVYRLVSTRASVQVEDEASTRASMRVETEVEHTQRGCRDADPTVSCGDSEMSGRTKAGHSSGEFQPARNEFQPARNGVSTRTSVQPTNPITPIQNTEPAAARAHAHEAGAENPFAHLFTTAENRSQQIRDSRR